MQMEQESKSKASILTMTKPRGKAAKVDHFDSKVARR